MTDARGAYLNVQANLLNDHLKLVAGTRFIKSEVSNRTRRRQDAENLAAARPEDVKRLTALLDGWWNGR